MKDQLNNRTVNKTLLLLCCALVLLFSCEGHYDCVYKEPSKVMSVLLVEDQDSSYWHFVLCDRLRRDCLDSSLTVSMLGAYTEKESSDTPISIVTIVSSVKGYDKGENLSQSSDFFKNVLLDVYFDNQMKVDSFSFYNKQGEVNFSSKYWKQ